MPKLITEIDEATWQALQKRAQQHGRTPEEEAAVIAVCWLRIARRQCNISNACMRSWESPPFPVAQS
jgi:plasmid stability protein